MDGADPTLVDSFRQAMRRVASTVNVITVCVDGQPMGITATAMSSLSMDPPSLLVCINRAAALHSPLEDVSHFGVNVLHADQRHFAAMFADRQQQHLRFAEGWELDPAHPPRLEDAQASLLCRRIDHHPFGTHSIFIGVVEHVTVRDDIDPLLYLNGHYGHAQI
ncbi:flavin reductase family protein [Allosphingosinicella flava]|uniref:Flavin reductase family protein n=1 Tax=Allosphingosinicella flava TaxID=2771430 RepID=A0A7T2GJ12_9SPHN|nr:flavin reductase family protein [Sphingosinicella flava]QPQ54765.1 flavin reductase family protein [Sphingosinicella flava]